MERWFMSQLLQHNRDPLGQKTENYDRADLPIPIPGTAQDCPFKVAKKAMLEIILWL